MIFRALALLPALTGFALAQSTGPTVITSVQPLYDLVRQVAGEDAEVVAENAGVMLYMLDPLGGSEDTQTYQGLMRYNARIIAEALK